jgi:hypothetical protein
MVGNFYQVLGNWAVWAVPVVPATSFGLLIYDWFSPRLGMFAIPVALVGLVGYEAVGILNGHLMVSFWQSRRYGAAMIAAALLVFYVALGLYELGLTIGGLFILIAFVMYLTRALLHESSETKEAAKVATKKKEAAQLAALESQRQAAREDAERQHALKLAELEAKKAVLLAKVAPKVAPQRGESSAQLTESFATDWRKLTPEQRESLRGLTVQQIMDTAGVQERTAQNWRQRLAEEVTQ